MTTKGVFSVTSLATAVLFGGGIFLYLNFGSIAKQLAQEYASRALGVPVSIARLEVSIQERRITASNIKVGNPQGFKKDHALTISSVSVGLNSISAELLDFQDIQVAGIQANLEVKNQTTNFHAIQDNINKQVGSNGPNEAPVKIMIKELKSQKGQLNPSVTLIGSQDLEPVKLPDIAMNDIGTKENGILIGEAINIIWKDIAKVVGKEAYQSGFLEGLSSEALKDIGQGQMRQIKQKVDEELDKVRGTIDGFLGTE